MAVISVYKPIGLTPFELIKKFKTENPKYQTSKIAFAGRLDPLARGKIIILTDDDRFNAKKYQDMDKVYYFKVIFGFETDSYDLLGMPKAHPPIASAINRADKIKEFTKKYKGEIGQPYPPFSAKTVRGKKLFWWARNNRLDEIIIPTKKIRIYDFEYLGFTKIEKCNLVNEIINKINKVDGDFRQEKIISEWLRLFNESNRENIGIYKFRVECSSGTYVRQIAYELGEYLGCGAVCVDIYRTAFNLQRVASHKALQ